MEDGVGVGWAAIEERREIGRSVTKFDRTIVPVKGVFVLLLNTNLLKYEHAFRAGFRAPT
jgi:hypothetical protein